MHACWLGYVIAVFTIRTMRNLPLCLQPAPTPGLSDTVFAAAPLRRRWSGFWKMNCNVGRPNAQYHHLPKEIIAETEIDFYIDIPNCVFMAVTGHF